MSTESRHEGEARAGGLDADGPAPGTALPALRPPTALAIRRPCVIHRWDASRRACLTCDLRIYVEVLIT